MLTYEPGNSLAHGIDARAKLAVQFGFAIAAFAHTTPEGLLVLSVLTGAILLAAETSPLSAMSDLRVLVGLLIAGAVMEGIRLGPPWFAVEAVWYPALAGYRVLLVLLVSAAYVRTTPVRETRAAIQRHVPGRVGQVLGVGVGFVVRFLPVLRGDLRRTREAMRARLGERRGLAERMRIVAAGGLRRAFVRADRLALALRARCFAWNPTLPEGRFTRRDAVVFLAGTALAASALL